MKRESGDKHFPIWLLGDSEPKRWQNVIDTPLDPRHAVRHIIWTPVLDVIQDRIFRKLGKRIDTSSIFIRNAIEDSSKKPRQNDIDWKQYVKMEIAKLKELISRHNPKIVLCFGAFSFEFARRALNQQPNRNYRYWGARRLGHEFRSRIAQFDFKKTNILPMLHRSVGGGKFLQSHEYFCNQEGANYFDFVGTSIAGKILENYDNFKFGFSINDENRQGPGELDRDDRRADGGNGEGGAEVGGGLKPSGWVPWSVRRKRLVGEPKQ